MFLIEVANFRCNWPITGETLAIPKTHVYKVLSVLFPWASDVLQKRRGDRERERERETERETEREVCTVT